MLVKLFDVFKMLYGVEDDDVEKLGEVKVCKDDELLIARTSSVKFAFARNLVKSSFCFMFMVYLKLLLNV